MDEAFGFMNPANNIQKDSKYFSDNLLMNLLFTMKRIRKVEERIAKEYPSNEIRCPTHLSIGQEAVAAAISQLVLNSDYAVSTHRGHAHYLAKGGDLFSMISEIYGKSTGCSKGKGGSMHLIDIECGFMGTSAIVGNSIPTGVGLSLACQLKDKKQISCIFLGDGAVEEGAFYESLNFSVLKNLPSLFICENNLYSVYSSLNVRQPPNRSIESLAKSIGAKTAYCDGNDAIKSFNLLREIIQDIRKGGGTWFVEFPTYRWREHCGYQFDNNIGYRTESEFIKWQKKDPIKKLENDIKKYSSLSKQTLKKMTTDIDNEINLIFNKVSKAPFPSRMEAYEDIYA